MLVVGLFTAPVAVFTSALSDRFELAGPAAPVFVAVLPALVLWFGTLGIELAVAFSALPTACSTWCSTAPAARSATPRSPGPSTVDTATPHGAAGGDFARLTDQRCTEVIGSGSRHLTRRQS